MPFEFLRSSDYTLKLSSGETIDFIEIDLSIQSPETLSFIRELEHKSPKLTWCTKDDIEAAKLGYDKSLRSKLRSPPSVMMIKTDPKICRRRSDCASFDRNRCNLIGKLGLPDCFEYDAESDVESKIISEFIHYWSMGKHVIVISS